MKLIDILKMYIYKEDIPFVKKSREGKIERIYFLGETAV
jgi:hypothetical protein